MSMIQTYQPFLVPLIPKANQVAQAFAATQQTAEQKRCIYLNTLAVYAVHYYLLYEHGIETDIETGDSWNPVSRALYNAADLEVPGAGKLECCPVNAQATQLELPAICLGDRIAYVVVELPELAEDIETQEPVEAVHLLGFYSSYDINLNDPPETIPFSDKRWQDIEALPERIDKAILNLEG